jgi:hypothetical protein
LRVRRIVSISEGNGGGFAENTAGLGLETASRESMIDPADLPDPSALLDARIGERGELVLTWTDGVVTTAHPGWLRHVAGGAHVPSFYVPAQEAWDASTLPEPPTVDGTHVLDDDEVLREWLT